MLSKQQRDDIEGELIDLIRLNDEGEFTLEVRCEAGGQIKER